MYILIQLNKKLYIIHKAKVDVCFNKLYCKYVLNRKINTEGTAY